MLRLQARMIGNGFFTLGSATTGNDFGKRFVGREAAQPAGFPFPEIFGDGPFADRFAEQHPRLVSSFGCDTNFREFLLSILGSVTTAKAKVQPHDGRADLVANFGHRALHVVLKNGMTGDAHMRAGHESVKQKLPPIPEEGPKVLLLTISQDSEAG